MSKFEQHIRHYYSQFNGEHFYSEDFGFFKYRIDHVANEVHFYVLDLYIEEGSPITNFMHMYEVMNNIIKANGCTHFLFYIDKNSYNYEKKKRISTGLFGFHYLGEEGYLEYYGKNV